MERNLLCPYLPEEMANWKDELSKLVSEYMALETKKKNADAGYNEQLTEIWEQLEQLEPKIKAGGEMRPVQCKRMIYAETGEVEITREDTGEVVEIRPWTDEERDASRQMEFPEDHMLPPPDKSEEANFK